MGQKEDFLNINNKLSSFLNTNKLESIKDKQNSYSHNNGNSTFNVYDDIPEIKKLNKRPDFYTIKNNRNQNNNNDNKNISKNDIKLRNNIYEGALWETPPSLVLPKI